LNLLLGVLDLFGIWALGFGNWTWQYVLTPKSRTVGCSLPRPPWLPRFPIDTPLSVVIIKEGASAATMAGLPAGAIKPAPPSSVGRSAKGRVFMASGTGLRVEEISQDLFEVVTQIGLSTLRGRRRVADLKEVEFLTLSLLQNRESMIVGDIQRVLGVLPAQMSRIIRALESRDRPLITCRINSRDKRKIDVCLTPPGDKALTDYREASISRIVEHLRHLNEDEQEDLTRLLDKLTAILGRSATTA
jgi:DNA-binding MarR family transcriptional regulator